MCTKSEPPTSITYGKYSQFPECSQYIEQTFLKEDYQKFTKNLTPFLVLNPVYGHYEKRNGPGTSHHFLFRLPNMFRSSLFLVIHYLVNFDAFI